jgi:hypothetical protein
VAGPSRVCSRLNLSTEIAVSTTHHVTQGVAVITLEHPPVNGLAQRTRARIASKASDIAMVYLTAQAGR